MRVGGRDLKIGLIADLHGDLAGFERALAICKREGAEALLCAGDVADRGADVDAIVAILKAREIPCVMGNHDATVVQFQTQRRKSEKVERLAELGRVVTDQTVNYLRALPPTRTMLFGETRLMMAHGVPWSDVIGIFANTRQGMINRVVEAVAPVAHVLVLGHTHEPLWIEAGGLTIVNPGSVYNITIRDSGTCAVLTLPEIDFAVYELASGAPIEVQKVSL